MEPVTLLKSRTIDNPDLKKALRIAEITNPSCRMQRLHGLGQFDAYECDSTWPCAALCPTRLAAQGRAEATIAAASETQALGALSRCQDWLKGVWG
jgi:hypothetical protein